MSKESNKKMPSFGSLRGSFPTGGRVSFNLLRASTFFIALMAQCRTGYDRVVE